ncbi:integrator complex subunit 15 isoform X1 [Athalia rosae]|uniref:integrator complex subunit 15 isoform X1 n=1 Tax=Athalia rosae TaxID=37344 RepID=UPI0020336BA2|nr:integrator complex subunit 15 isoform X1 [Athalia rosae]
MSGIELIQALRKLDFPFCAREALCRIEMLCAKPGKQMDLQMDMISEFVFGEIERRKKRMIPAAIQELQLVEVLSDFFQSSGGSPPVRNAVFLSLFPAESSRHTILGYLVSLAIATQNKPVLNATGIWMQQLGSTSTQSVGLARHILQDYFVLTPSSIDKLKQLPVLAAHFTANLLTAVGEVYKDRNPPTELLKLIGDWINENPSLLLTSLVDNPALPTGGIPMTPITPIAGLFRWCVLSPLRNESMCTDEEESQQKFYSKIQQLLMDSVLRLKNSGSNKHAISAQHLAATTRVLSNFPQIQLQTPSRDLALERLAQAKSYWHYYNRYRTNTFSSNGLCKQIQLRQHNRQAEIEYELILSYCCTVCKRNVLYDTSKYFLTLCSI